MFRWRGLPRRWNEADLLDALAAMDCAVHAESPRGTRAPQQSLSKMVLSGVWNEADLVDALAAMDCAAHAESPRGTRVPYAS